MTLEDVIESLNKYIENRRFNNDPNVTCGHFVLHKSITPAPTFKSFKEIEYSLWLVRYPKKHSFFTKKQTYRVISGMEKETIKQFELSFLVDLFKLLLDGESMNGHNTLLEDVIHGEYLSDCNE